MTKYYTGVGSRRTPSVVMALMADLAAALASAGWILRSGAADGADAAFEYGARRHPGVPEPEIFLPWRGYNGHASALWQTPAAAYTRVARLHPAWDRLSSGARKLHARNVCQVLGPQLQSPSAFLVCWTPDGCTAARERTRESGGTATAIVLAEELALPRFNLQRAESREALRRWLAQAGVSLPWPDFPDFRQATLF